MKHNVLRFLLQVCVASLLLCSSQSLCAQPEPMKFGKVEMAELDMKSYAPDTSAEAVILSDYGKSYFEYRMDGFKMVHKRHVRIKILKKSGYEWATVRIPFYRSSGSSEEKVVNLHAYTYNKEGGKLVKEKLTKEAVFEEEKIPNWFVKSFTMPNVKEGSVIEYEFSIESDFFLNMREWEFQSSIPVAWSEYRVSIPEYFNYRLLAQGYEPFSINETGRSQMNILLHSSGQGQTAMHQNVVASTTTYRWVTKDIPALRNESFITTMRNYITKIEFELSSIQFPGQIERQVTSNWQVVTENLLRLESFGQQLNKTGFAKEIVATAKAKAGDPSQQIAILYDFVQKSMKWNNFESMYASGPLRKSFENHTGSSGDINLMLVALLREAGLDANPVILSTRKHGFILESYTLLHKFNYVIAHVALDGKDILLDATDPLLCVNMLPIRCLNGQGRLISKVSGRWVPLHSSEKLSRVISIQMRLDKDGQLKGTVDMSNNGYSALPIRKEIVENGQKKYEENLRKTKTGWEIEKLEIKNIEKRNEALGVTCQVAIPEGVHTAGNMIYIKPLLTEAEQQNPFKNDVRKFPVDFEMPVEQIFVANYTLPEGYVVEELPKSIIVDLPEKGGRFSFLAAQNGSTIQVTSRISIRKVTYLPAEYPDLKEFYHQIVSKHAEQIVLQKQ